MYIFLVFSNLIMSFLIKNKKIILVYFILSYTLMTGLRYDVGIDYLNYQRLFFIKRDFEIGYNFFRDIIYYFNGKFFYFTLLTSFFTILPIYYYFKINNFRINDLRIGIFLFLISDFNFSAMNLIRQSLAVSFCFLSADFYYKKKYINFIFLFLVALCFHKSVYFYLIFFLLINNIRIKRNFSLSLIICLFLLKNIISFTDIIVYFLNYVNILYPGYSFEELLRYAQYTQNHSNKLNYGLLFLIILYTLIIKNSSSYLKYFEKFMFFSLIFRIFASQNFIFNRISFYFDLYIFLSIFKYHLKYKKSNFSKRVIFCIAVFILFANFIKNGYFSSEISKNRYYSIFSIKNLEKSNIVEGKI